MQDTQLQVQITALHAFYLPVSDAGSSAEWYKKHFGCKDDHRYNEPGSVAVRLNEGAALVLVESDQLNVYESNPLQFKCNDALKAHTLLDKEAVRAKDPVQFHHYVDFAFQDPDGNTMGAISDPAWAPHPNNFFRIDGVFLGAANFEATLSWYQRILHADIEYDFTVATPSSPEARMCCFRGIPLTVFDSPASVVHRRFCDFRTRDAAADHAYLKEQGVPVTELSSRDGVLTFALTDPEGREIGMVETE